MKQPGITIQALSRGLGLLESVAARGGGGALTQLCKDAGLHRSTAHHLLRTLVAHGYVTQDEATRAYRIGPKVYRLASASWSEAQLAQLALPYLRELVRATGETANLAIRKDAEAILLETVDGEGTLRVVDRIGAARPIHACAVGKVLLAFSPAEEREPIVDELKLKPQTPRTIVERDKLRRELAKIRAAGYGLDDEEMALGVRCVAAPVYALPGQVVAAVGVAAPAARVTRGTLLRFGKPLSAAARRLSARLARIGE
jgi:DNA-binding IclR family transcriptional regulator